MASRRIEDLDIRLQPLVRDLLARANQVTAPWQTFITDGFRSYAEQAALYAKGRTAPGKIVTNAKPGTSNHEKGLAVDLAFQNGGRLSYDEALYKKIVPIAKSLGFDWGGDWSGFPDKPHFEKLTFAPTPVVEPVPTFNNQTKIPLGESWGDMELGAIRSTLNDQKRDLTNAKNSLAECVNRPPIVIEKEIIKYVGGTFTKPLSRLLIQIAETLEGRKD